MKNNTITAFDMHTHSEFSHDSKCSIEKMLKSQSQKGIKAFAVTDHCDMHLTTDIDVLKPILACHQEIDRLNAYNATDTGILKGIEIGEGIWYPMITEKIISNNYFDVVLSSVHTVRNKKSCIPYSQIDFSIWTNDEIYDYLDCYFDDILLMTDIIDFDVLSHLTVPLKYINQKYQKNIGLDSFTSKIQAILSKIIAKEISLEINTSEFCNEFPQMFPNKTIIKEYVSLGGKYFTLASDAHTSDAAAVSFKEAVALLKDLGINECCYYKARKKIKYNI